MKEKFKEIFAGFQTDMDSIKKANVEKMENKKEKHSLLENRSRIIFGKTILMVLILLWVSFPLMNLIIVSGVVLILISIILNTRT